MNAQALNETAWALVAGDKGLLAMDESNPTCNKRFARLGFSNGGSAPLLSGTNSDHTRSG